MARILPEVIAGHLKRNPREQMYMERFARDFDVTWANNRKAFGSDLSVYLLKPESHMDRAFGFQSEILAVYSSYDSLEDRTLQSIARFHSELPALGRVDPSITFLVTKDKNAAEFLHSYSDRADSPVGSIVVFVESDLITDRADDFLVRRIIADQLYQRDLFDYRLPINNDYYFFGRDDLVTDMRNTILNSNNYGLFGLRKSGKTSLFYKIERYINTIDGIFIYVDCKDPDRYENNWRELLKHLTDRISSKIPNYSEPIGLGESDAFKYVVGQVESNRRIVIVFDEFEYVTPSINPRVPNSQHWQYEFIPFWNTMWTTQSQVANMSIFVGGVNPSIVESNLIENVPNPLFMIIPRQKYATGLSLDETRRMVRRLGRPMGLRFNDEAIGYIHNQYGGHPLLTRLACSWIHNYDIQGERNTRPWDVDLHIIQNTESERDEFLAGDCSHILDELELFYNDEYLLLQEMATSPQIEWMEFYQEPEFKQHLDDYGITNVDQYGRPAISINLIVNYFQRVRGTQQINLLPPERRESWVNSYKTAINDRMNDFHQAIISNNTAINRQQLLLPFGVSGYPKSKEFSELGVVYSRQDFGYFVNICNQCFVEPIDNHGKIERYPKYFDRISEAYPALGFALNRIKAYRINQSHLVKTAKSEEAYQYFIARDLQGVQPNEADDGWFRLQQCVLYDLLFGIQRELARFT